MSTIHGVDYEVIGAGIQMLVVGLAPNDTVIVEAEAMNFMDNEIEFAA
jgi:uncharacterized protein (AIM24 family)